MNEQEVIASRLRRLSLRPFRATFHLRGKEQTIAMQKGLVTIQIHAEELIAKRLAPASPLHDGKQTPYKGHPVFVAQHATATCCRSCLERWHTIPKDNPLTVSQQAYVVKVILTWIKHEINPQ